MNTKLTHREEPEQSTARTSIIPSRNLFSAATTPKTSVRSDLLLDFEKLHEKFSSDAVNKYEPKDAPSSVGESFIRDLEEAIDLPVPANNNAIR
jgi:hypothetical protein